MQLGPSSGDGGSPSGERVVNYTKSPVCTVGIVRYCGSRDSLGGRGEKGWWKGAVECKIECKTR